MNRIWATADYHLHHFNLCSGTTKWFPKTGCRQFDTIEEYDSTIINNTNKVVMPDDTLINIGDFSLGSMPDFDKIDAYIHFRNKINCKNIIYVRGNHSLKKEVLDELGIFSEVHEYYEFKYRKRLFCCFHFPIHSWSEMKNGSYHLFGHEHSGRIRGRSMDVGLDGNNFYPWLLDDIIEKLRNNEILKEGHHQ